MILDERVRTELAATTRFRDIRLLAETDSTNRVLLAEAATGAPEGVVVAAEVQTAGRGRLDRTWEAEPGVGLLVSILLRPAGLPVDRWHLITAAAGLAAQEACEQVAGVLPELKWPNDLMWDGRKLAGILAEIPPAAGPPAGAATLAGPPPAGPATPAGPPPAGAATPPANPLVLGMGLNVHGGPPGCAYLDQAAGARVGRAELLVAWLAGLDRLLDHWDEVAKLYRDRCATVGRQVSVEQLDGSILRGRAEGLDEKGRLIVQPGAGDAVVVTVGDVTHLRAADK